MKFSLQYPLSHPLNKVNVKKFIAASAPDARDAVRKFIKHTTHITFEQFIGYINHNLEVVIKDLPEDRPIYIYIDNNYVEYKQKSNYWLYLYINQLAQEKYHKTVHVLTHLDKRVLKDNDIILLIDDCIYSGRQMAECIYAIDHPPQKRLHFKLFVPFLSQNGVDYVFKSFDMNDNLYDCTFSLSDHVFYITPLSQYLDEDEYMSILQYYHDYEHKQFRLETDIEEQLNRFPIYFDHKLADHMSSFPEIYGGLVPNEHNLKNTKEIDNLIRQSRGQPKTEEWKQRMTALKKNFELIPLITHCEHIDVPEFDESSCPVPPYKKELFNEFISLVKEKPRSIKSASRMQSNSFGSVLDSVSPLKFGTKTKRSLSITKTK
jgi:hypothetical protein